MATEGKSEETQMEQNIAQIREQEKDERKTEDVKDEEKNEDEKKTEEIVVIEAQTRNSSSTNVVENGSSSSGDETSFTSELKEYEKKALFSLRMKIEEAVLEKKFLKKQKENDVKEKSMEQEGIKEEDAEAKEKSAEEAGEKREDEGKEEEETHPGAVDADKKDVSPKDIKAKGDAIAEEGEKEKTNCAVMGEKGVDDVAKDISLWGVPLLPSKGDERTDVILLKFLRAREWNANNAFEMLRNTLQWRKDNNIDSILDEEFEADLCSAAYMDGKDREGHPVCYNMFGILGNAEILGKILGNEEKREKFLRWRVQLMEKGIKMLDFKPGGVSTMLQINDLRNAPGPTKKELRFATRKAVDLLQDNYPEFVAQNIFINIPLWYYAFSALLSPFLTQRTKNKFVYARPSKVEDTLFKYVAAEEVLIKYGGLKNENDSEFTVNDSAKEAFVKAGSTETIVIPAPEVGNTLIWEVTVSGWEVNYKEEFVPTDEKSYTIIVQKGRKISWQEGPVRNSFKINNEPGNIMITIENGSFKKKHILYRYKTKNLS